MIWEEQVLTIVMTTRTVERGRTKCGQYWPLELGMTGEYGKISIANLEVDSRRDYTLTSLMMHNKSVRHYCQHSFFLTHRSFLWNMMLNLSWGIRAKVVCEKAVKFPQMCGWPVNTMPPREMGTIIEKNGKLARLCGWQVCTRYLGIYADGYHSFSPKFCNFLSFVVL